MPDSPSSTGSLSERAVRWVSALPPAVPVLFVFGLVLVGGLAPWGWALIALATLILVWVLVMSWPRLTPPEKLLRLAVIALLAAVSLASGAAAPAQAAPSGSSNAEQAISDLQSQGYRVVVDRKSDTPLADARVVGVSPNVGIHPENKRQDTSPNDNFFRQTITLTVK